MKDVAIRIVMNERLTRITHWTMFSLGAASLTLAIAATAANVL